MNGLWALYIVTVILAWLSGKYMTTQDIQKHRAIHGGLICIIFPFIPIVNLVLMAMAL